MHVHLKPYSEWKDRIVVRVWTSYPYRHKGQGVQGLLDHAESPSEGSGLENCGIDDELV